MICTSLFRVEEEVILGGDHGVIGGVCFFGGFAGYGNKRFRLLDLVEKSVNMVGPSGEKMSSAGRLAEWTGCGRWDCGYDDAPGVLDDVAIKQSGRLGRDLFNSVRQACWLRHNGLFVICRAASRMPPGGTASAASLAGRREQGLGEGHDALANLAVQPEEIDCTDHADSVKEP